MNEISNSIAEAIRKRTASATLGTYFFFWAAYHWQGIYVTFFVDQSLIYKEKGVLKNEYVNQHFFGLTAWNDVHFYLGIFIPALLTYLYIWWLPYILTQAYKKEQWLKVERRIIKIDQEKRIQEDRKKLAQETTKAIKEEEKVVKARKDAVKVDPKILWGEEFAALTPKDLRLLSEILKCVYRHRGHTRVEGAYPSSPPEFVLNPNALRLGDAKDLVKQTTQGARIELTPKGKYFASKYPGVI